MFPIVPERESAPATLSIRALSRLSLAQLARVLGPAILGNGGWVLERRSECEEQLDVLFEFPCDACLEMYGLLVSCGLEVSRAGHRELTSLWLCSRHRGASDCLHIARIALTVLAEGGRPLRDPLV